MIASMGYFPGSTKHILLELKILASLPASVSPAVSGIMGDIARNRHTGGFAHILVDSLPVASRIPSPTCIRKYLGTHELAPLGSLSVLGLGLPLRGPSRRTGICWYPSIPNHSL
jgi:hypothetical protein